MTKKKEGDPEINACLQQEKDCRMTKKKEGDPEMNPG
jgi:hypothetical protein